MNRLKRELRKKGIKLECDYPCLPFYTKGKPFEPGYIFIDGIRVKSETAEVVEYYNVDVCHYRLTRKGNLEYVVTLREWLDSNEYYEQATILDSKGKPCLDWIENDPKFKANVIDVLPTDSEHPWIEARVKIEY